MANFVESELESLAVKVAEKVLAEIQPTLVGLADTVAAKVIAEITGLINSKLGGSGQA